MSKIISIHQPCYLPWLGFFHKILMSDEFVILDHVQFEKNSFINRNRILQPDGRPMWLTIPMLTKGKAKQSILDVEVNPDTNWVKKHKRAIELCYSKTPYFNSKFLELFDAFDSGEGYLYEVLSFSLGWLCSAVADDGGLFILRNTHFSSTFRPPLKETKSDLVLEICKRLDADVYLSGAFGQDYLDLNKFKEEGIKVVFQNYLHPIYPQYQRKDEGTNVFVPNMSVLDLLFNCGPKTNEIIMRNNETREDLLRDPS